MHHLASSRVNKPSPALPLCQLLFPPPLPPDHATATSSWASVPLSTPRPLLDKLVFLNKAHEKLPPYLLCRTAMLSPKCGFSQPCLLNLYIRPTVEGIHISRKGFFEGRKQTLFCGTSLECIHFRMDGVGGRVEVQERHRSGCASKLTTGNACGHQHRSVQCGF